MSSTSGDFKWGEGIANGDWNMRIKLLDARMNDMLFYETFDTSDVDEDIFGRWFIKTFGEMPLIGERLPEPEFQGLAERYENNRTQQERG